MSTSVKVPESKAAAHSGQGKADPVAPTARKAAVRGAGASTGLEQVFLTAPPERIAAIKLGVPAAQLHLVRIEVPGALWDMHEVLSPLPASWDAIPSGVTSRKAGDLWGASRRSPLLAVPSVIVPDEFNVLINPLHPAMAQVVATTVRRWVYDPRFF